MSEELSFLPLLLVVFLAFFVPLALSRFKQLRLPIVVGEILAGVIVGRSGFNWVSQQDAVLDLLAQFGFVFLMFLAGMEIDFSNLGSLGLTGARRSSKAWGPVTLGSLTFALTLALSIALGFSLTALNLVGNPWMMALILSTTSLGVVMPVLKEQGLSSGLFGQTILIASLIADFATMLLITVVVAMLSHGLTLDILLIGVLFVAFFLVYHFGIIFFNRIKTVRLALEELTHTSARIKVRAAFTMMLVFVALSQILGAEVILGAFLAGVIISLLRTPDDMELSHQLETIGFGFFIPIFFVMVGIRFDLTALFASSQAMLLGPLLLLAAIIVKLLPALVFKLNFTWREALAGGVLLSARLSLIIAASALGLRLGVISESVNTAIILVAIITVTAAPLVFTRLAPQQADQPRLIVVIGADEVGLRVAEQLRAHRESVVIVDQNEINVTRARSHGFETIVARADCQGDPAAPYLEKARAVICASSDTEWNYCVCQAARSIYGIDHVVAHVNDPSDLARFEHLGVKTINTSLDRAVLLALLARSPATYNLFTRGDDNKELSEVVVTNQAYVGQTLRQLILPGDVLILAVLRDGELLVPHGNTRLNYGDYVTLIGSLEHLETARQMMTTLGV